MRDDPVKKKEWDRKYYEGNRDKVVKRQKTYYAKIRETNPMIYNYRNAKSRCKKLGIPFTIDYSDLEVPEYCPYLGIKLQWSNGLRFDSPSMDRIIPELGYVKGNVQVISQRANLMKNDASIEQLVLFARNVLEMYGDKVNGK